MSSARCASEVSAGREGQSMFPTVAIQSPRISRMMGGGAVSEAVRGDGAVVVGAAEQATSVALASASANR